LVSSKQLAAREEDQDMPGLLDAGIDNLLKLDYIYQDGEIEKKREVMASMYPEKLTFDYNIPDLSFTVHFSIANRP
jgi:site-specific DNA recombinase